LLVLVARERPGQLASGIGAILEWHLLTSNRRREIAAASAHTFYKSPIESSIFAPNQ
jgi:hypothetical protein